MESFSPNSTQPNIIDAQDEAKSKKKASLFSYSRIFTWFGIGLLVTAIISLSLPFLLNYFIDSNNEVGQVVYLYILIIACAVAFVSGIAASFSSISRHAIWIKIFYMIYAVSIGVLLSSIFFYLGQTGQAYLASVAFFISAGCFIVMGGIGLLVKKDLGILWPLVISLILGCIVVSLVNFFMNLSLLYWIVEYVILAVVLLSVAIEMNQIKKLVLYSNKYDFDNANTMAIYCAYSLYVYFINIFMRVLNILMFVSRK